MTLTITPVVEEKRRTARNEGLLTELAIYAAQGSKEHGRQQSEEITSDNAMTHREGKTQEDSGGVKLSPSEAQTWGRAFPHYNAEVHGYCWAICMFSNQVEDIKGSVTCGGMLDCQWFSWWLMSWICPSGHCLESHIITVLYYRQEACSHTRHEIMQLKYSWFTQTSYCICEHIIQKQTFSRASFKCCGNWGSNTLFKSQHMQISLETVLQLSWDCFANVLQLFCICFETCATFLCHSQIAELLNILEAIESNGDDVGRVIW